MEGSIFTPTTAIITQFARRDGKTGGRNINKGSGYCDGTKASVANLRWVFAPAENSADQDKLDGTVGACRSDDYQTRDSGLLGKLKNLKTGDSRRPDRKWSGR
jgi:hypothetical protein